MRVRSRVRAAVVVWPVAVCAVGVVFWTPFPDEWSGQLPILLLTGGGLVLVAALLWYQPDQRTTALLFAGAAVSIVASWLRRWSPGPVPWLRSPVGTLYWPLLGWALLRYPGRRLELRRERWFVGAAFVWLGLGHAVIGLLLDPAWLPNQYVGHVWWPTIQHARAVYFDAWNAAVVIDAGFATWYVVLCIARIRRLRGVDRWALAPLAASVVAAAWPLIARVPLHLIGGPTADAISVTVSNALLMLVPAAFLTAFIRAELARSAVADAVTRLAEHGSADDVVLALGAALRDPSLRVLFAVPNSTQFIDGRGAAVALPASTERLIVPLIARDGEQLGVLDADPSLSRHASLVDSATSAATLALENAQLQAALLAQLEQLQESRRRIAEATVEERRRLERDLHDGAQQRLLALNLTLAEMRINGASAESVIERVRNEIRLTSEELRQLARGIHPAVLAQSGLPSALQAVAERIPIPVKLTVSDSRFTPAVETTIYFLVCEALTNVLKHARADHAAVSVQADGDRISVQIDDNGVGGADPRAGTGISGLTDRVRALGGELVVASTPGSGTHLRADLPCG